MKPQEWIDEWCNLYPSDVEFNGHKLKSKPKECLNKMLKFCKDNPLYTKDVIFAATQRYVEEKKAVNWEYMKQSTYFISKMGQPSLLENYCEKIVSGVKANITESIPEYNFGDDFI